MTQSPQQNAAQAYEGVIVQDIFVPWSADLIERAAPKPGERVLDLACGSGILMRQIAPMVGAEGKVVGLDINPALLEVARTKVPTDSAAIEFHEGSGTAMPFEDGSFDLVVCEQGLQFFPDHAAGLSEMRRVLAPGGRAVVSVWRDFDGQPFLQAIDAVIQKHFGTGAFAQAYSMADAAAMLKLAVAAGFEDVEVAETSLEIHSNNPDTLVPMMLVGAAAVLEDFAKMDPDERQAKIAGLGPEMAAATAPFRQGDELVFRSAANVMTARA